MSVPETLRQSAGERLRVLDASVKTLRGVGPKRVAQLARLGITTLDDLLHHLPRAYHFRPAIVPITALTQGSEAAVCARIESLRLQNRRRGRDLVATIRDASGTIEVVWFGQAYLQRRLVAGERLVFWGKVDAFGGLRFVSPHTESPPADLATWHLAPPAPIYPLTEGLTSAQLAKWVTAALECCEDALAEPLPEAALGDMPGYREALETVHRPGDRSALEAAWQRLAFNDRFFTALALGRWRHTVKPREPRPAELGASVARAVERLPFALTTDQTRALDEVAADLAGPAVMHRLLEGEVGSGKTVVALVAAHALADLGELTALMVPTALLAHQHARSAKAWFPDLRVGVVAGGLGGVAGSDGGVGAGGRRRLMAEVAAGQLDLVVGTQALLGPTFTAERLGLVVIDEQHRFGVRQRATLHAKGAHPDMLVMSATPIPRSLGLAEWGELEVSVMRARPQACPLPKTYLAEPQHRQRVENYIERTVAGGHQVLVVAPRIDSDTDSEVMAVQDCQARLVEHPALGRRRIETLDGRRSAAEREAVLARLRRREVDVLVATTVIEVGLHLPGVALIVIESPERYGLSQLHQLRGRAGRGEIQGICILQLGGAEGAARQRLSAFAGTGDGFEVAELDLEERGAGDVLGLRQHGSFGLEFDTEVVTLREATTVARHILKQAGAPGTGTPLGAALEGWLNRRHGRDSCLEELEPVTG